MNKSKVIKAILASRGFPSVTVVPRYSLGVKALTFEAHDPVSYGVISQIEALARGTQEPSLRLANRVVMIGYGAPWLAKTDLLETPDSVLATPPSLPASS